MNIVFGRLRGQIESVEKYDLEIPESRKTGKIQALFDYIVASFRIYLQLTGRFCGSFSFGMFEWGVMTEMFRASK